MNMDRMLKRYRGVFLLFFMVAQGVAIAQTNPLTGVVTDAQSGIPIAGATVLVQGTQRGTATDFDGNYTLDVSANDVIVVSYIGYKTLKKLSCNTILIN